MKLLEVKKSQLVSRSRSNPRFNRRLRSKLSNNTRDYQLIDMNKLFKKDILEVGLPVKGETGDYTVTISYEGVIATLKQYLKTEKLELRLVVKALISNFNNKDIFINCNCKDFCLVGNTKIKLLDGRTLTIEEIVNKFNSGEELWVYSSDDKGDFKPGKITNAWLTKYVDKTILVELDNGSVVETTPEHLFMLRDGTYVEAQHLEPNTSLMPMYLRTDRKGYEQVRLNSTPKVKSVKVITHNKPIPVYDIEVPEWHNFRVDAGVMVHNSYRFNYWSTVNRFNANNPEMRPSKITNPNDSLGSTCKHGQLILNNTGWALKVASVINNYIKFMKLRNRNLYDKIISPALYDVEPEEDINKNQLSIFDVEPVEEQPTKEQPGEAEDEQV